MSLSLQVRPEPHAEHGPFSFLPREDYFFSKEKEHVRDVALVVAFRERAAKVLAPSPSSQEAQRSEF